MQKKIFVAIFFLCLVLLFGCHKRRLAPPVPGAEKVTIGKGDPADNYADIGPVSGAHGKGCGGFGTTGTYEGAIRNLKDNAARMGADYVQIFTINQPHLSGNCFDNLYSISGTAFKKIREQPSPTQISTPEKAERNLSDKLREFKKLKEDGLISEKEYIELRKKALNQ
jgi:hypothetical protein